MPLGNWFLPAKLLSRTVRRQGRGARSRRGNALLAAEALECRELLTLSFGTAAPQEGNVVAVPLNFQTTQAGLIAADLTIAYDTARLNLPSDNILAGAAASHWNVEASVNESAGVATIAFFPITNPDPLGTGNLELLVFQFEMAPGASGEAIIDIVSARLNEDAISPGPLQDSLITLEAGSVNATIARVPSPAEQFDQVDTLPAGDEWIDEWTPHWLEVWASTESDGNGINHVSVDVGYDADFFTPEIVENGDAFNGGFSHEIDTGLQRISLTATRTVSPQVGDGRHVLIARIFMQPVTTGPGVDVDPNSNTPINRYLFPWERIVQTDRLFIDSQTATLGVATEIGPRPTTQLWPVMFDLDDDGRIGFGDLSIFTGVFLQSTGEAAGAIKSDFDLSGRVGFGDLSLFTSNFLRTRGSSMMLDYPDDFPSAYGSASAAAPPPTSEPSSNFNQLSATDVLMQGLGDADDDDESSYEF